MSQPTTKKLFPIGRYRERKIPCYAFERKPGYHQAFNEWDEAADVITEILERAFQRKIVPMLAKRLDKRLGSEDKTENQCTICYMKTICGKGPLPELGRCDFCPGGDEEEEPKIRPIDVL